MSVGLPSSGQGAEPGTVYLLHFDPPYKHARHYTGWTTNLDERLEDHRSGRRARLMQVVREAGGAFRLVRTWPGPRALERAIKDRHAAPRLCPVCSPQPQPVSRGRSAAAQVRAQAGPQREPGQPPQCGSVPGAAAVPATERTVALVAEFVPLPSGLAGTAAFPGRPASQEFYRSLWALTDELISDWQAQAHVAERDAELETS